MTDVERIAVICLAYGVTTDQVRSYRRQSPIMTARRECYRVLRNTGLSYPAIGRLMNRDHSTIVKTLNRRKQQ